MNDISTLSEIVAGWAKGHPLIEKAWLFGSRVRGEERPDSDLDVAVVINELPTDSSPETTWHYEREEIAASLQAVLPVPLQLEWYGGPDKSPAIHAGITRSSLLVYDASGQNDQDH